MVYPLPQVLEGKELGFLRILRHDFILNFPYYSALGTRPNSVCCTRSGRFCLSRSSCLQASRNTFYQASLELPALRNCFECNISTKPWLLDHSGPSDNPA